MLRLVIGRAGSGKTSFVLNKADEIALSGGNAVIIVPEQFTFETERALLSSAGPGSCRQIEVLSFTRIIQSIQKEYGGFAGRYIDDTGRIVLMQRAVRQVKDLLTVYQRQASYPSFIKSMLETAYEYKQYGVTPEILAQTEKLADGKLAGKLHDLSLILGAYEALLGNGIKDSGDDLTRLGKVLDEYPYFKGRVVLIDAFKSFTVQEKGVIRRILIQADDVFITSCADCLQDDDQGYGLFSPVKENMRALIAMAKRYGVAVAAPIELGEPKRFLNEPLRELESRIFRPKSKPYEKEAGEIHIIEAGNIYEEVQYVAQEIARIVREEGVRYRDIVVISRGLEAYRGIIDPVFEKYEIPLFLDSRKDIECHPLMTLLLCSIEIITSDYRFEPVFRYLKTGLSGFSPTEVSELENYVFTWDIKGANEWNNEWGKNPEGFAPETNESDEQLSALNMLRRRFVEPVERLSQAINNAENVGDMLRCLYDFFIETEVENKVTDIRENLMKSGEIELADEYGQIREKLISIFDGIALVAENDSLSLEELYEILHLAVSQADIAHIPPSIDEVTFGDAERIRTGNAKYAFVIGLSEGVFPRSFTASGIITDTEREKLIELGLEMAPPARKRIIEERYIAYCVLNCASRGLYLSYPRSNMNGRTARQSQFLLSIKALFPCCITIDTDSQDRLSMIQNERSAFEYLALHYREEDPVRDYLLKYFKCRPEYENILGRLQRSSKKFSAAIRDQTVAKKLFGKDMQISPTRLEAFELCRFNYFCRYGLRAKTRKKAAMTAPEVGSLIHYVLERLLSSQNGNEIYALTAEEIDKKADLLLDEFARLYLGGLEDKPQRFRYLYLRLKDTVTVLLQHIVQELRQSSFIPVDFELGIGPGADIPSYIIKLPDGGSICVTGKVDRVDLMEHGGNRYIRVIDYKTGSKEFKLKDVVYGLNLQMLIYLYTLCENAGIRYESEGLIPAGVLYLPAKRPDVFASRQESAEKIKACAAGKMKMSGLILSESGVIRGMEREAQGIYIPAKLRKDEKGGADSIELRSSVASLEQFGILQRHIDKTLEEMALSLQKGDISAVPAAGMGYDPCGYCEFRCICGFENGDPVRYLHGVDNVWDALKGGGDDSGKALD